MGTQRMPQRQGLYDPRFEHDACGVGFVCDIKGRPSHGLVRDGLTVLCRLSHRGAVGADPHTGDGAGILIQMPHAYWRHIAQTERINLPPPGEYATGMIFFPTDTKEREVCRRALEAELASLKMETLGWRNVPVDDSVIGKTAKQTQPFIAQIFIKRPAGMHDPLAFERLLYVARRKTENTVRRKKLRQLSFFYITNLSQRTFTFKGLLMPHQVEQYFLDLRDSRMESAIVLVHSRYSTNTFPSWDLAQPFRFLAHNGEINTLRGNINWMGAKEGLLESPLFGCHLDDIKPIIVPAGSDSASLDNVLELLVLAGRSLPHAMLMLMPAAWERNPSLDAKLRDFYRYHTCLMEPWDGPAAVAVTDGVRISAALDRNGLRPARYLVTKDERVIMASEVGVLDIPAQEIAVSGRLEPGKMFYVDTEEGRIVGTDEVAQMVSSRKPYGTWLRQQLVEVDNLAPAEPASALPQENTPLLQAFGFTREDIRLVMKPMAETGQEPTGSMGNDTPPAVLSRQPQLLYAYFKQLFAQVTNPAIDPIREELVMSLECFMGGRKNLLGETPEHCHKLHLNSPILTDEELAKIRAVNVGGFKTATISLLFNPRQDEAFMAAIARVCGQARQAIRDGYSFVILSDRGVDADHAALPALLATGAVHQHLVNDGSRSQLALIVESAEPREVHHFAVLFGFGAGCVNPYLAYEVVRRMAREGDVPHDETAALRNYRKALDKGLLKILSKMGISTLQCYRGAQIFEALGIQEEVIERCFSGTASRIGGADFETIRQETVARHATAFPGRSPQATVLSSGGIYQWRHDGEFHLWNPETIALLQDATRMDEYGTYEIFARRINDQSDQPTTLRSLLRLKNGQPIPLEEIEPESEIVKRFATGAMSFGSISKEAHESLAIAMNRLGGRSNTGEGGEDPARFFPDRSGDSRRSAVKQVASGRFGVSTNYLVNADELQIKICQGAKPGEGGQLPGHKVSAIIARTRYTTPGVTLISPPPHHDIYSIEDLAQLIFDLKNVNPRARISVKLVSALGVGTVAAGVAKGHADMILIAAGDGGTGASPLSSIKHAGLPWELGLSETHQTLVLNNLRSRVRLQTDGQMRTGRDVAIAALLGAEEFGFGTAGLIVMGCVMLRHCHMNNCSVGVATQDEMLRRRFRGTPEHLITYFTFVAKELRQIMAELGLRTVNDMIGRTDLLEINAGNIPAKARRIDFSRILYQPLCGAPETRYCTQAQEHPISDVLDQELISLAWPALLRSRPVRETVRIKNSDRAVGAMVSGELVKRRGEAGLPDDTIRFHCLGTAGQSFGAWLAKGITLELEGMANDYVGKGLSGGRIIVYPDKKAGYNAEDNIIIGNTTFYGAVAGEAYIRGRAGERFCIRNSGAYTVVEGVGDHGCEYMTGGRVVVLGPTGRNFGAGMSGGIAYVYDADGRFPGDCNQSMVELETPDDADKEVIHALLHNHQQYTGSSRAGTILSNFDAELARFVKVMPVEYKNILTQKKLEEKLGLADAV